MGVFDDIYNSNGWGFGSGHGSLPSVTKSYRKFLEDFIRENNITSVVDYGCGDWQFSKLVDWGKANYIGLDIVPSVVETNQQQFGSDAVRFSVIKPNFKNMPAGDLLIIKDVLQHLPNKTVQRFVKEVLPNYKFALITNCIEPTDEINNDIEEGGFRPLDLRKSPFNVKRAVSVHAFTGPKSLSIKERKFFPAWKKLVLLVPQPNV